MKKSFLLTVAAVWAALSVIIYILTRQDWGFTGPALHAGNAIMAVLVIAAFLLVTRDIAGKPHAFVRGVTSATMLKLFVCAGAILGYGLATKPHTHKATLFVLCGIYLVYTVAETILLSGLARKVGQGNGA
jgi:hypothetical protein